MNENHSRTSIVQTNRTFSISHEIIIGDFRFEKIHSTKPKNEESLKNSITVLVPLLAGTWYRMMYWFYVLLCVQNVANNNLARAVSSHYFHFYYFIFSTCQTSNSSFK